MVSVYKQLDALRLFTPACKYVHLSSAAVYGNPTSLPIQEDHALAPISPYGKHKKMAEEVCEEFYSQFGIETLSLRIFSAYGTGLKKQLFWDLYKKYLQGGSIELYGTGRESRDFIYVTDLVQAINCVINNGEFNGTAINIANGEEVSIEEVASLFYGHIDKKIKPIFGGEERKGDPINWVADINGLQKLGYERKVTMDEGLSNYITWRKELG